MRWNGASAVSKVAVRSLPLGGFSSVSVGVYEGEMMTLTPVRVCRILPMSSLSVVALWKMVYPSIMKVSGVFWRVS